MSAGRFTEEQTVRFLHLYEHHRCLWDWKCAEYRNIKVRREALENIVAEMNIPNFGIAESKIKIKNIRSHYCQELKKMRDSRLKGGCYEPSLSWFDKVHRFLGTIIHHNTGNLKNGPTEGMFRAPVMKVEVQECAESEDSNQTAEHDQFSFMSANEESNEHNLGMSYPSPEYRVEPSPPYQSPILSHGKDNEIDAESALPPVKRQRIDQDDDIADDSAQKVNEFDVFGSSVSAQLNNMPFEHALRLQLQIQELITNYRLNYCRKPT